MDNLDFEPFNLPPELDKLKGRMIEDLFDLVYKFGNQQADKEIRRLSIGGPRPLHVAVFYSNSRHSIMVSRTPGHLEPEKVHIVHLLDGAGSRVVWQKGINIIEVFAFIIVYDSRMARRGYVHPVTAKRYRSDGPDAAPRQHVLDDIFVKRGDVLAPTFGMSARELRALFDRPRELAVLGGNKSEALCRKDDLLMLKRKGRSIRHSFLEWALNGPGGVRTMSDSGFFSLVTMIQDALRDDDSS